MRPKAIHLLIAATLAIPTAFAAAQTDTSFTYQGKLTETGVAVTQPSDFKFRLYDADSGGTQIGGELEALNVTLAADGTFTVDLDFGSVFTGDDRWLEIDVRSPHDPGDTAPFTPLSPRQPILAAPYAMFALNGGVANGWTDKGSLTHTMDDVGIGTTSPEGPLHVMEGSAGAVTGHANSSVVIERSGNNYLSILSPDTNERGLLFADPESATNGGIIYNSALAPDGFVFRTGGNTNRMVITDTGSVGIGTNSPATRLHVVGNITSHVDFSFPPPGGFRELVMNGNRLNSSGTAGNSSIRLNDSSASSIYLAQGGGNVGIGTGFADTRLVVGGGTDAAVGGGGFLTVGDSASANIVLDNNEIMSRNDGATSVLHLQADGGDVAIGNNTGTARLGIGIAPLAALHVDVDSGGLATFYQHGTSPGVQILRDQGSQPALRVISAGTGPALEVIGTSSPALEVSGTASVDVLEITGADVAEKFPVSDAPQPGMVVEIDPDHPGKLRIARGEYNHRVAGVVSGAGDLPVGAVLGHLEGSEDAPPIALTGRVWVKCDAAHAAIEPGDLLTTSGVPGHAMKSTDRDRAHGAIIGKAMTPLAQGERELVLVLVNLQ